ncbi:tripartite tricarboxylate transporter TctB family protein [Actinoplanes sp. NPDC049548]|uniref:tripartite tricarboxylate transporter TctB family protein n=1 Tax=Actinoplanes sp. NPDC049548 TaxID=3155152 RepID=UPI00342C5893
MSDPPAEPRPLRSDLAGSDLVEPDPLAPSMPMVAHATLSEEAEDALPAHGEHDRGTLLASAALGVVMMIGAVVVLVDAAGLRPSDEVVGPAVAPTAVGILLGVLGALLVLQAGRHLRTATAPQELPHRRLLRLAAMVALLVAFAVVLPFVGYVVASALLFTGAALLLGAPHPARTAAYGWTLAGVVFLVFDRLIGLALPAGPWGF